MSFLIGSLVLAVLVTLGAARGIVAWRPGMSARGQGWIAALSFPALACLVFAVVLAMTIPDLKRPGAHAGSDGMAIFALVMFLFYALFIGFVVGLPLGHWTVRLFRH